MAGSRLGFLFILLGLAAAGPVQAQEPAWSAAKREHWAWKAPAAPAIPVVRDQAWVQNPVDAFILAPLEGAGLAPAARATRTQLIRRVTFDLIGLPPTPEEIDAFVNDCSADAWEKVVNRLLASPHYGERWGRHWLDLARFAESNGYEFDEVRPDAWRYRDYVIAAFNNDKPYDRYITEQLAGDELAPNDPEALIATAFNLLGPDMTDASSQAQRRQNTLDDMADTASLVVMGLTMGCARCHNHKFEPISIRDFYCFQAFFAPTEFKRDLPVATAEQKAAHRKRMQAYEARIQPTVTALKAIEEPYRTRLLNARMEKLAEAARIAHQTPPDKRTGAQIELVNNTARFLVIPPKELAAAMSSDERSRQQELLAELKRLEKGKPPALPMSMGLQDTNRPARAFVLKRGELSNRGEEVEPAWPSILASSSPGAGTPDRTAPRLALARWLTRPDHPLTARVLVNRVWQHHFGRGIVATPSDFGVRGARPTHPELLDWLALDFVNHGWSIKHVHRRILLSAAYQQSSIAPAPSLAKDPDNQLFSRMNRMRLEGEIIRDSMLALGGRLNGRMGGPGVFPPRPAGDTVTPKEWATSPNAADHVRRSIYIFARRNLRFPFLEPFDMPDSNHSCPQRERSTTAPQALALLNASDVSSASVALAKRLEREGSSPEDRIRRGYQLTLGRAPTAEELHVAREFLADSPLSELCRALFNLNEFVYLD